MFPRQRQYAKSYNSLLAVKLPERSQRQQTVQLLIGAGHRVEPNATNRCMFVWFPHKFRWPESLTRFAGMQVIDWMLLTNIF